MALKYSGSLSNTVYRSPDRHLNDIHVMPTGWGHESSPDCWCKPRIDRTDPVNEGRVWVHKAPA